MHIRLVGTPQWWWADMQPQPLARKDAAMLALMALEREPARDRVAAWLWPEAPLAGARVNLRQRLFKLRQLCKHPLVGSEAALRLLDDVAVDLLHGPLPLEGRLLGDLDYGDLGAFDDWLGAQRQQLLNRQIEDGLQQVLELERAGDLDAALRGCERLLARDAVRERCWQQLMRLHYLRGDRAAAVAAFQRCERVLGTELGIQPGAETLQLLAQIERLQALPSAGAALPAALARPPRMVGRTDAIHRLQRAWDEGRAVLLLGEGGIGKTRLLEDFVRGRAGLLNLRIRPGDAGTPYAGAVPLLRLAWQRVRATLDEGTSAELARLLPEAGTAPRREGRQPILWQAVETLLAAAAAAGVEAIAIDDLHHADDASLDLLRWLVGSPALAGLRWLFAARADEPASAASRLRDWSGEAARIEPVPLRPLAPDEVAELLASLGMPAGAAASLPSAEALHRHAGGHPFFTLETLKDALAGGGRTDPLPLPASARAMLLRRLQRLSPAAQDLLRVLALADGDLPADVVAEVLGVSLLQLAPAWADLEEAQLTRVGAFAHDLVREVAVAQVPQPLRPGLHAALAEAMARQGHVPPARLAVHWQQARRPAEAAAAWRAAAAQARRAARLREMDALLMHAADAFRDAGDSESDFDCRCDALESAVWRGADEDTLARARTLLPQAPHDAARARVLALQAQTLMSLLKPADALVATRQGLPLSRPGTPVHDDLTSLHGRGLALAGQVDEALALLEQACAAAAARQDTARQLVALSALAHALATARQPGRALQVQQQATELARRGADAVELTIHLCNTASAAWITGDASLIGAAADEAMPLMDRLGVQGGQRLYTCSLAAIVAAQRGRYDLALGWMSDVDPAARATTGIPLQRLVGVIEGWIHLQQGDAAGVLSRLDGRSQAGLNPSVQAQTLLLLARAALDAGQDEQEHLQALQGLLADRPALADEPMVALEAGRHGHPEAALARLQALAEAQRQRGAPALALSLDLVALERLLQLDAASAADLARVLLPRMAGDLHPLTHPPQAWGTLAQALQPVDAAQAAHAHHQARAWLDRAVQTVAGEPARRALLEHNPRNRRVQAGVAAA